MTKKEDYISFSKVAYNVLWLCEVRILKRNYIMEYKGKLFGKVHKSYFPLEATTDDWDAMKKRISELEAENQALRQPPVGWRSEQLAVWAEWLKDNYSISIPDMVIEEYKRYNG